MRRTVRGCRPPRRRKDPLNTTHPQKNAAIATHSSQADEFAASYERESDPNASCFTYSRKRLDAWLERLLPNPGTHPRLLDVGCGTGHHMARLRQRGFVVSGVDGSVDMLAHARRNNPGADIRQADVEALPFDCGSFDAVLSIEVLRYLPRMDASLAEMARVLRPGGVAVVTATPRFNANGYWLVNRLAVLVPVAGLVRLRQFFTTGPGLRRALRRAGFATVEIHGVYTGPINWLERVAPRRLPALLRAWEGRDAAFADAPVLRELSNMFVTRATRG